MKSIRSCTVFGLGVLLLASTATLAAIPAGQTAADPGVFGRWYSTERFENEARISVGLRQAVDRSIQGWVVMLGQHRKSDDRATLGLSFSQASVADRAIRFETVLPEDEGTIGWELRVLTPTTAVLRALTENGAPIQDELRWDMTR